MSAIKKILFSIILVCLQIFPLSGDNPQCIQPVKKIYLKKESDKYFFCIDFIDNAKFTPRIHILPNGAKVILSFNTPVNVPKTKRLVNHSIINGYFFEKIGSSSLMMVLSLKGSVSFTEKRYTQNSVKIGFKVSKKRVIVIDAGHGGRDPGTRCITGDYEKNVTLVMAVELRNMLATSGKYKVVLTRDGDAFVPIEARKEKIATSNADFLISLHTDSNDDPNIRGISVYTLPNLDFVKQNNFGITTEDYYETLSLSRKFSNILVGYIPNMCKIKNRPCRDVELKILKASIPAVLIELGCVSNKIDNQLLHSKAFRDKVSNAILYALDKFFEGR